MGLQQATAVHSLQEFADASEIAARHRQTGGEGFEQGERGSFQPGGRQNAEIVSLKAGQEFGLGQGATDLEAGIALDQALQALAIGAMPVGAVAIEHERGGGGQGTDGAH
jgi:hypothetical protein